MKGLNNMIKIKDLQSGDIIYQVWKYHWISKIKITSEYKPFEYQSIDAINNHNERYYIEGISTLNLNENNFSDPERLFEDDENSLYDTLEEAKETYTKAKQDRILYLQEDNNLLKELYKEIGGLPIADKEIYEELINNCEVSFNNK